MPRILKGDAFVEDLDDSIMLVPPAERQFILEALPLDGTGICEELQGKRLTIAISDAINCSAAAVSDNIDGGIRVRCRFERFSFHNRILESRSAGAMTALKHFFELRPILRRVADSKHLNIGLDDLVDDDVGQRRENELACVPDRPDSATMRHSTKQATAV